MVSLMSRALLVSLTTALSLTTATATASALNSNAPAVSPGAETVGQALPDLVAEEFTASTGQSGQYHLTVDHLDRSLPVGLIVQLHGDGAGEFENYQRGAGKLPEIEAVAEKHNMVLLAPRTPTYEEGDQTWWSGDGAAKGDYLAEVIDTVAYSDHDIDRSNVWFTSYSGGSEQLTTHFLPDHLDMVEGGGALITGGGGAYLPVAAPTDAGQDFRMHWLTGSEDQTAEFCGVCAAEQGEQRYESAGFEQTSIDVLPDYDHYELQGVEAQTLDQLLVVSNQ